MTEIFTPDDEFEVMMRHALASAPVPIKWDPSRCTCGIPQVLSLRAHLDCGCLEAARYIKAWDLAGMPLTFEELQQ